MFSCCSSKNVEVTEPNKVHQEDVFSIGDHSPTQEGSKKKNMITIDISKE